MGGREAMAGAPSETVVATARAPPAGRAVLRRLGRNARAAAEKSVAERRQSAPDQLLPMARTRARHQRAHGECRAPLLPTARALQPSAARWPGRERRDR